MFTESLQHKTTIKLIQEAIQKECYSMSGANYVAGMAMLARELGIITMNEHSALTSEAWRRAQAAEKLKREQAKAEAEQRKAERAAKARAAKQVM